MDTVNDGFDDVMKTWITSVVIHWVLFSVLCIIGACSDSQMAHDMQYEFGLNDQYPWLELWIRGGIIGSFLGPIVAAMEFLLLGLMGIWLFVEAACWIALFVAEHIALVVGVVAVAGAVGHEIRDDWKHARDSEKEDA